MPLFSKSADVKTDADHLEFRAQSPDRVYIEGSPEEKALLRKIDRTFAFNHARNVVLCADPNFLLPL
jgi:hypothetical protein